MPAAVRKQVRLPLSLDECLTVSAALTLYRNEASRWSNAAAREPTLADIDAMLARLARLMKPRRARG